MKISKSYPPNSLKALTTRSINYLFSNDTLNLRVPLADPLTGKLNDDYLHRYQNYAFEAYLTKRRLKRSQIWPRIHIIDGVPEEEEHHLGTQRLFEIKKLLDDDLIERIIKNDPSQIESGFILSVFCEQNFKELIDEYVSKVLVCGKSPSLKTAKKMQQIEHKTIQLYRNYYFGEMITPLEREIQIFYLAAKQDKSLTKTAGMRDKERYFCRWTQQDQRVLEDIRNWCVTDINSSDLTYRPFYEPLKIESRKNDVQKFFLLSGGSSFLQKFTFNYNIKKDYEYSVTYLNWIKNKLFSRTLQYTKCLQFTHSMRIPPDFAIELCVLNAHIWLIVDRLNQFDSKKAKNLSIFLTKMFNSYIDELLGTLNLKKLARIQKTYRQFLEVGRKNLTMHFNVYAQTRQNPYLGMDALVWSTIYKQKVHRYSDDVYMFSEYLVKNHDFFQTFTQEDLLDGMCEFDCYLIDPDHKQKIIEINPQLSKQQFEEQFKSDKENKKYYYRSMTSNQTIDEVPFEELQRKRKSSSVQYSLIGSILGKIIDFSKKYLTDLNRYDHFNEMDKQKKDQEIKEKQSAWKTNKDKLSEIQSEFSQTQQIRRNRAQGKNKRASFSNILEDKEKTIEGAKRNDKK